MALGRDGRGRLDRHASALPSAPRSPGPRVGVLRNPRSHGNRRGTPAPNDAHANISADIHWAEPARREDIEAALRGFAERGIDLLVVDGGDGTIRDVLSAGLSVWGERFPALAVLARGKTNALAIDLGIGQEWTVADAVTAWRESRFDTLRPLVVTRPQPESRPVAGFILGAGAFTRGIAAAQDAHRMGAFGNLAVALTMGWGLLQIFLGSGRSAWRRGTAMALDLQGPDAAGARPPDTQERHRILLAATTLRRLPLGLRPFGPPGAGIKVLLLERPRRRLLLAVPAVLAGWRSAWLERAGLWRGNAAALTLSLRDEGFVLDGETYPPGRYSVTLGQPLRFVVP